jgi:hypothetical protein
VTAFGFEREERRCAVEAAEDAGELDDDRPTRSDLWDWDETEFDEGEDDE